MKWEAMSTQQAVDAGFGQIGPGDPRYRAVVDKRFNKRFRASPDYVRLVSSTEQVVAAVEEAVREGRRLVVMSGGHCLEGFVSDPEVRVILDISPMKRIDYDAEKGAVAVEAGATVGETFRTLFETWGGSILSRQMLPPPPNAIRFSTSHAPQAGWIRRKRRRT